MVGPKASRAPGKRRRIPRHHVAVEWRRTSIRLTILEVRTGARWSDHRRFRAGDRGDDLPIRHGGDGGVSESLTDPFGDLARADAFRKFLDRSIGQLDVNHRPRPVLTPAFDRAIGDGRSRPTHNAGQGSPVDHPLSKESSIRERRGSIHPKRIQIRNLRICQLHRL